MSDSVRWSIDVRFEACPDGDWERATTPGGRAMGFPLPGTGLGKPPLVSVEEWMSRWEDMPAGSY